ncbi:MAG: putative lipid II flippase FtsW [Deltaproteobacteria bacterium]|nr:putative lipid II flippase FtsW [Deltaproteobacteria bacterium]
MVPPAFDPEHDDTVRTKVAPTINKQAPIVELPEKAIDMWMVGALLTLLTVGTLAVFSSSAVYALDKHGDPTYFLRRHLVYAGLGLGALWLGCRVDYRWLERRTYALLLAALVMLVGVLVMGIEINGARRWFRFGPLTFQPVEVAKLALISYLAYSLGKKADKVKTFTVGFVPHLLVCCIMMVLLLKQPDLGSSVILGATTILMLFVAGAKITYITVAVLGAAPIAYFFIVGTPWRMQRFLAYLNPEAFADGAAYQLIQSQIAIGSGGAIGVGLGQGRQALGYMPEGHSDFVLAGIGEELGFLGLAVVFGCFAIIVWRGIKAAALAREVFGSYLAFGISLSIGLQALFNGGVVLGVLPNKGITLPFVSYGGSSLVMSMFLAGLVLAVGRRVPPRIPIKRSLVNVVAHARRKKRRAVIACGS